MTGSLGKWYNLFQIPFEEAEMACPNDKPSFVFSLFFILLVGCCSAAFPVAGEVFVHTQTGILHATADASCPPDNGLWREDLITMDLVDYMETAEVDTFSSCGHAAGTGSLNSRIEGHAITVELSALSELDSHRSSSGSAFFQIDMEITAAVDYTMTATGNYSSALEPGVSGLSFSLAGVHYIHENRPDFSETWEGTLGPGNATLSGSCTSSRAAREVGGGVWLLENGMAELSGSVTLTFSDAEVVEVEDTSLGSLKAKFR